LSRQRVHPPLRREAIRRDQGDPTSAGKHLNDVKHPFIIPAGESNRMKGRKAHPRSLSSTKCNDTLYAVFKRVYPISKHVQPVSKPMFPISKQVAPVSNHSFAISKGIYSISEDMFSISDQPNVISKHLVPVSEDMSSISN
jgi:hypothetical protein